MEAEEVTFHASRSVTTRLRNSIMRITPRRLGVTMLDVLVSFAVVLLVCGGTGAQIVLAREAANRIRCASNLKQLGMAILLYSNENRGAYPRTTASTPKKAADMPPPVWGTPYELDPDLLPPEDPAVVANPFLPEKSAEDQEKPLLPHRPRDDDVTAALFLLMRTQQITSNEFVCPSSGTEKFDFGGGTRNALHWTNWPGKEGLRRHLSYSYNNPYPSMDAIGAAKL
ncbi:MAG: DUF1559 domain-containing protein, partial [Planctomycetota bacterium]|nr:DUF1559 domain-containing protein [Planctomycetota bacterium]